jgi:signal transduction histidine kinase/ligand-binding sensor domain-containing protein/DNA-binding response OmpR family regulator
MSVPSRHSVRIFVAWLLGGLLCVSITGVPRTFAQSPSFGADSSTYVARTWTTEEGLPQNMVWSIAQDDVGHLWVGTMQGIARFDGHAFTTYDAATTEGLAGNRIHAIVQSSAGALWIGTESGVSVRHDERFRQIDGPSHVVSIDEGPKGTMWMGGNSGVYRTTADGVTQIPIPDSLMGQAVWDIEAAAPDSVWIVTTTEDLLLYHDGTIRASSLVEPQVPVYRIGNDANGPLWVATTSSVISIQDGIRTRYPYLGTTGTEINPKEVRLAPSGTVWVTTYESGLFRLADASFRRVHAGGTIPERVAGLHRDESGQWWVGTQQEGLIRLRSRLFHRVNVPDLEGPPIHGVYADTRGNVWVGTSGEGLLQFDESTVTRRAQRDGIPRESIWSVARDRTGAVWASANMTEVVRGRQNEFEPVPATDGDSFQKVHVLYRDPKGDVWIGSAREGIHRYAPDSLHQVMSPDHIPSGVRTLHRAEAGGLWIGTRSDGVARYQNGTLTWYDADDGVPYQTVRDVYETDEGTIWIATYGGGIARFDSTAAGGHFTPVTRSEGLPDGTIHAIREVPTGMFWMTSNKGVFRVPRAQVEAVANGRRDRLYAQTFGPTDGMPVRECNGNMQPAIAEGPDGKLWIPTLEGLTRVNPHDPRLAVPDSIPMRVTEVRADGTPRPLDSLRFAPNTYRLAIDFSAISLRHADDLSFRYRLDDASWTPAQSRRTAEFTTLNAGVHQFEVQATINGETWYTLEAPLRFTVAPHFYETGWFRLLVVLGLLGLVGGAYLWRTRVLRRRQEQLRRMVDERTERLVEEKKKTEAQAERLEAIDAEKSRFFANISHELRTPLTILQGTLRDAIDGSFGDVPAPLQRQLGIMRSNVRRLHRLTGQLLDLARLETADPGLDRQPGDLVELLRRCTRQFTPLAERRGVHLDLETEVPAHPCRFDPKKMEKVVDNLLSNALKNTPEGGQVRVRLTVEAGDPPTAVVRVTDTGTGIPPDRQEEIFERFARGDEAASDREGTGIGLALVREYTELHDGTIDVTSAPGDGSTFTVRLSLPSADPAAVETEEVSAKGNDEIGDLNAAPSAGNGLPEDAPDRPVLLVVEDNEDVRAYLRRHLADDYYLVEASNGAEGLDTARTADPDLVLTDRMMPEMDGVELCQKIRADDDLARTPVVLLTARAAEEDAVAGLEAGADAYVTKPFSIEELRARLHRLLDAHWAGVSDEGSTRRLSPDVEATSADEAFLDRVTDAIDEHRSRTDFTVEDLAAEVGLSPRQLRRKLKELTGQPPAAFIRHYRLDAAAQLLRTDAGTVAEVAYRVGFGTPETFATHFEDRFGCSPSQYPEAASPDA